MKVLKQPNIEGWKYEHTCVTCDAVLEVELPDLRHTYVQGDRNEAGYDKYYATCPVCNTDFVVPEGKMNKAVKYQAQRRSKPSGNYFDR